MTVVSNVEAYTVICQSIELWLTLQTCLLGFAMAEDVPTKQIGKGYMV